MPEAQAIAKRDIGFVSAEMRLLPHATLGWHMQFVASIYPGWDAHYAETLVKRFNLRTEQKARADCPGRARSRRFCCWRSRAGLAC